MSSCFQKKMNNEERNSGILFLFLFLLIINSFYKDFLIEKHNKMYVKTHHELLNIVYIENYG